MKCPHCGADIEATSKTCEFCGSQITYEMRREHEQVTKQGCPKCASSNVEFKRENQGEIRGKNAKQIIHRTVGVCKDCGYTWYTSGVENDSVKKNTKLWWILGWIFFFPAPVMVLIWRKKNTWDIRVKIGVTVAFWIVFFIIGLSGGGSDSSTKESTAPAVEVTINEESTEVSGYDAIDRCYDELIANNTSSNWNELSKQIIDITKKYDLYQDSKNNGLGVRYAKIATTSDEAKVISNDDLDKGTYYIRIVADFSKGSPDIQLIDNRNSGNFTESTADDTLENLEIIYELNDGINEYINHFNTANPDTPITSEMAQPYHHHGSDHENQIKFIDDKFEIVITGGTEVYIGYMPSTAYTNDEYKEMFKKYLKGFELGLDDSQIDSDWETIMNDLTHNVDFDSYSADVYMSSDRITYMTISKK